MKISSNVYISYIGVPIITSQCHYPRYSVESLLLCCSFMNIVQTPEHDQKHKIVFINCLPYSHKKLIGRHYIYTSSCGLSLDIGQPVISHRLFTQPLLLIVPKAINIQSANLTKLLLVWTDCLKASIISSLIQATTYCVHISWVRDIHSPMSLTKETFVASSNKCDANISCMVSKCQFQW